MHISVGKKAAFTGGQVAGQIFRDVPSILLDPVSITKDNVGDVISDGGQSFADVCTGDFAQLCTDAGITG